MMQEGDAMDGGDRVTLLALYGQMSTLTGEVRTQTEVMRIQHTQTQAQLQDHEQRIRSGERWRYGMPVSLVIAAASALLTIWSVLHG